MGKNKLYAIAYGVDPDTKEIIKNKVVKTWSECQKYINGVKGAKYKSFTNQKDVDHYFKVNDKTAKQSEETDNTNGFVAYVDGSYNNDTGKAGMGLVLLRDGTVILVYSGEVPRNVVSEQDGNLRQTVGELCSAYQIANEIYKLGINKLTIYHDYEGVSAHALGLWKRNSEFARDYYDKMQSLMSNGLDIKFIQTNSHQGDLYNEIADDLAKFNIGVDSTNAVQKLLEQGESLTVINGKVKKSLTDLGYPRDKIKVQEQ